MCESDWHSAQLIESARQVWDRTVHGSSREGISVGTRSQSDKGKSDLRRVKGDGSVVEYLKKCRLGFVQLSGNVRTCAVCACCVDACVQLGAVMYASIERTQRG